MKYKLWSKEDKKFENNGWIMYPDETLYWTEYGEIIGGVWMEDYTLIKSTEIKDINGTEIYEGDILKCKLYNGKYENYEIVWDEKNASFDALNKDKSNFMSPNIWRKSEIIGNKFENPELL